MGGFPAGTVRQWKSGPHEKQADGTWDRVTTPQPAAPLPKRSAWAESGDIIKAYFAHSPLRDPELASKHERTRDWMTSIIKSGTEKDYNRLYEISKAASDAHVPLSSLTGLWETAHKYEKMGLDRRVDLGIDPDEDDGSWWKRGLDQAVVDVEPFVHDGMRLGTIESQIRGRKHEFMVLMTGDRRLVGSPAKSRVVAARRNATVDTTRSCMLPDGATLMHNATLTHNHPLNAPLSLADFMTALTLNLEQIRAVTPEGGTWYARRPRDGWPHRIVLEDKYRDLQMEATDHAAAMMHTVVKAAGGDPEDGTRAKGYTREKWAECVSYGYRKVLVKGDFYAHTGIELEYRPPIDGTRPWWLGHDEVRGFESRSIDKSVDGGAAPGPARDRRSPADRRGVAGVRDAGLAKARGFPIGTVRKWKNGTFRKEARGWVEVIEEPAQEPADEWAAVVAEARANIEEEWSTAAKKAMKDYKRHLRPAHSREEGDVPPKIYDALVARVPRAIALEKAFFIKLGNESLLSDARREINTLQGRTLEHIATAAFRLMPEAVTAASRDSIPKFLDDLEQAARAKMSSEVVDQTAKNALKGVVQGCEVVRGMFQKADRRDRVRPEEWQRIKAIVARLPKAEEAKQAASRMQQQLRDYDQKVIEGFGKRHSFYYEGLLNAQDNWLQGHLPDYDWRWKMFERIVEQDGKPGHHWGTARSGTEGYKVASLVAAPVGGLREPPLLQPPTTPPKLSIVQKLTQMAYRRYAQRRAKQMTHEDAGTAWRGMAIPEEPVRSLAPGDSIPLTGCTAFSFHLSVADRYKDSEWTRELAENDAVPVLLEVERDQLFDDSLMFWHDYYGSNGDVTPAYEVLSNATRMIVKDLRKDEDGFWHIKGRLAYDEPESPPPELTPEQLDVLKTMGLIQ